MLDLTKPAGTLGEAQRRGLHRASVALVIAAMLIGGAGMAGWLLDLPLTTSWLPWLAPIRPNAALLTVALGAALLMAIRGGRWSTFAGIVALGSFVLGLATAAEWLLGRDLVIDHLFWPSSLEGMAESGPDRMSVPASIALTTLALAVIARTDGRALAWLVEPAALVAGFPALFALVSLVLGADTQLAFSTSRVSLPGATAAGLLVVALVASRPTHRTVRILFDPGPAGRATRQILPAVGAFPVGGWLVFQSYEQGWLEAEASVAVGIIFGMAYAALLLSRSARRVNDLDRDVIEARKVRDRFFDLTADLVAMAGPDSRLRYVSAAWRSVLGYEPADLVGHSYFELVHPDDVERSRHAFDEESASGRSHTHFESRFRHRDGSWRWVEWATHPDPASGAVYAVGRDVTALRQQRRERELLATVVEQSSESIIITDAATNVLYVNPAFERATGRPSADVLGRQAKELDAAPEEAAAIESLRRAVHAGEPWAGEYTVARADGSGRTEAVQIRPVHDAQGALANWFYIGRDVTRQRSAEAALEREIVERAAVTEALTRLDLSGDLDDVAERICDALRRLPGADYAAVLAFGQTQAQVIAAIGVSDPELTAGASMSADSSERMRVAAERGPWTYVLPRNVRRASYDPLVAAGLRVLANAPIRNGDGLVGVIRIGTSAETLEDQMVHQLPALSDFAAAAGGALGPALEARMADERMRTTVRGWIDERAFSIVFQPIVELASRATLGYEALTRFDDETRADRAFAEARAVGLGLELELATIAEALRAAAGLPAGLWLDLNVSPALLLDGRCLAEALGPRDRPIVLEVTEHERIDDYGAIREAVRSLGADIRLAVDDAGAGAANLVHMVELRPDFVKLDVGLVRGINLDPTRQALVVGLRHFARTAGCLLVAEGIETEAEAETLASFGIEFGQGYWLGRPAPADSFESRSERRPKARLGVALDARTLSAWSSGPLN